MSAPVSPAEGRLFEPDERILWWLRPRADGSRRSYLVRRFTRSVLAFSVAALATLVTVLVVLPLLRSVQLDVTTWMFPLLVLASLVVSAGVLLTVVGLLSLLIPEPACPPSPRVVADLLYVFTNRRLLVVRASRGSGRAYQPDDLAPDGQVPPTYRIDEVRPGVGNILVGVPGPTGWVPRISLWNVPNPSRVVAQLQSWASPGA
ncbi:MAG: hypothetical protein WCA46_20715 [Actinocatenispora sp.]